MEKKIPDERFILRLEEELLKLPCYTDQLERNDSWMTSKEIAACFSNEGYGEYIEEDIENFLLDTLKGNKLTNIRAAKYPTLLTIDTLWGHKERTFDLLDKNTSWKTDEKKELRHIHISKSAKKVFLSHSAKDFELA